MVSKGSLKRIYPGWTHSCSSVLILSSLGDGVGCSSLGNVVEEAFVKVNNWLGLVEDGVSGIGIGHDEMG